MRTTIAAVILLVLAWLGYLAWPIYTLGTLARAVEAGDAAAAMRHVDLPAVRRSITDQIVETYLKLTGKSASPLIRGAIVGAAGSIADPIVGQLIDPPALTAFLREGWPQAVLSDRPAGISGLSSANLGNAWDVFAAVEYGLRRFELELPPSLPRDRRVVLEFRLTQWRWQLEGVRMPDYLRVRLAELLIKTLKR
jgi:Protein of unknown function (DUF2939)